jgi:hypothetical protein
MSWGWGDKRFGELGGKGIVKENNKFSKDKFEPLRRDFSVFGSVMTPRRPVEYRARS